MPITRDESGNIMIEGEDGMAFFRLLQLRGRLSIELNTGMKAGRGPATMNYVRAMFPDENFPHSRKGKEQALELLELVIDSKQAEKRGMTVEEYRQDKIDHPERYAGD